MRKFVIGVLAGFAATIVAAKLTFDAVSAADETTPVVEAWSQGRMEFVAWNGAEWTAWIRNGEFELVPQDTDKWSRYANPTIAFADWKGEQWQAKIDGDTFVLAHHGDWQGETEHTNAMRYRDWSGRNQLRTVAQLTR